MFSSEFAEAREATITEQKFSFCSLTAKTVVRFP